MAKAFMLIPAILEHTDSGSMWEWSDNMMLAVFWVSSGYVSNADFSIKWKAFRLLLPYVLMNILCLLFVWIHMDAPFEPIQLEGILYGRFKLYRGAVSAANPILMGAYNSVLWFLPSFFLSYIVFRVLISVKGIIANVGVIVICLFATWAIGLLPVLLPWSLGTAPAFGCVIYMGRLVRITGLLRKSPIICFFGGGLLYALFNYLVGFTNISIGDFGRSVFLWFPAAVCGAVAFISLCYFSGQSIFSRVVAWFNRGALFIFGMQLVFTSYILEISHPWGITMWELKAVIVLAACFGGGKILALLYNLALPVRRRNIVTMM
ncbi:MAG: hypothetical protein K2M87_03020 [Muribaculaceae bacterium]|nr:hypothetical protein [Muribaculaceae bacterium]